MWAKVKKARKTARAKLRGGRIYTWVEHRVTFSVPDDGY